MAGAVGPLIIRLMTIDTGSAGQVVVVVDVAGSAGHRHMRAGQGEPG